MFVFPPFRCIQQPFPPLMIAIVTHLTLATTLVKRFLQADKRQQSVLCALLQQEFLLVCKAGDLGPCRSRSGVFFVTKNSWTLTQAEPLLSS